MNKRITLISFHIVAHWLPYWPMWSYLGQWYSMQDRGSAFQVLRCMDPGRAMLRVAKEAFVIDTGSPWPALIGLDSWRRYFKCTSIRGIVLWSALLVLLHDISKHHVTKAGGAVNPTNELVSYHIESDSSSFVIVILIFHCYKYLLHLVTWIGRTWHDVVWSSLLSTQ